jgi:hypothetical protein
MERFNQWETENLKLLDAETRLKQFVILFEMGALQDDEIKSKMHREHMSSISPARLRNAMKKDSFDPVNPNPEK